MRILSLACLFLSFPLFAGEVYTDPKTGISILSEELELPAGGFWVLSESTLFTKQIGYAYIEAPEEHYEQSAGKRTRALQERRMIHRRRSLMWGIRSTLGFHSEDENRVSTDDLTLLDLEGRASVEDLLREKVIAIVPGIPLSPPDKDAPANIMIVELQPDVDDGKHFVYYNNGRLIREEIDTEKMQALGFSILKPEAPAGKAETVTYTLKARLLDPNAKMISFTLKNHFPATLMQVSINAGGQTEDRSVFTEWAEHRAYHWWAKESRLAGMWDARVKALYGVENFDPSDLFPGNDRNRTPSVMGVLGGDAAIRETLQMQNLVVREDPDESILIPIEQVKGVTVKAHEYEALLDGKAGGKIALADLCPADRLFAWFPNPEGVLQLLDGSGNVLGRFSGSRSELILDHQIMEKHLAKLGLNEQQLRMILQSGFVGETAVLLPDLFLTEGTDVTTLTRINNMAALQPLLKGMGLDGKTGIQSMPAPNGGKAYLLIEKDLLMFSTAASELGLVQQVLQGQKPGLGESAEFRYMLTQCAPTDETAAFVYLSDPFIRRLTGPALKIAQLRRLQTKAELEKISAGQLLYRMDHRKPAPDVQTLVDLGYASAPARLNLQTWKDGKATDAAWGSADKMQTLTERLPIKVTQEEKKAYDNYRESYERFWRQFFDPIAVRVDLKPEQEVETTVFILPLINSSIYDTVRQFFPSQNGVPPGNRPVIEPAPIALMSLNLSEEMWISFIEGISEIVEDQMGIDLPIWELIGPGLHFGLADSDSIITFGSGELLNIFSAGSEFGDEEMLFFPLIGSLLTRPVVIAMDLQDPAAAKQALRGMATGNLLEEDGWLDMTVNLVKITDEDRWLIRMRLGDVLFITLSMEIQDSYLVFSNLPLTYHPEVTASAALPLRDASVLLQPGAVKETGPGFEASTLDQARKQALAGLGVLNLYYMAGFDSLDEAMATSRRLFGYVPVHPSPGEFIWTERGPESSVFGSIYDTQQPPLDEVDTTGLLPQTEKVDVSMQLENEGLRTRLLWKGKAEDDAGQ